MHNTSGIDRVLIRSAVLSVDRYLKQFDDNDDICESFEIIKKALVVFDHSRVSYSICGTALSEFLTLESLSLNSEDISPVNQGNLASFVSRNACTSAATICSGFDPLQSCKGSKVHRCDDDVDPLSRMNSANVGPITPGWSIGKSRRTPTTLDTEQMYQKYIGQLGRNWNLDLLALSNLPQVASAGPIYCMGAALLKDIGERIHPEFNNLLPPVLKCLQDVYLPNPYHNALHAATVGHMAKILASCIGADQRLEGYEQFAFIMAALSHDAGHPGRTNAFLSQTGNPLAIVYNDNSILENYHAFLAFNIMRSHADFYKIFTGEQWVQIRKRMIQLILATDMKLHFTHVNSVKERRQSGLFSLDNKDDFWLVLVLCIKAGDVGHNFLPWVDHLVWTHVLFQEFYLQGDEEHLLSMPLLLFFDRTKAADIPQSQLGFFQGFTKPMLEELIVYDTSPQGYISNVILKNAMQNLDMWARHSNKTIPQILNEPHDDAQEPPEALF
ncbi:bifunctional HD-PDEase domain/3'5'-cyclic nucleotide phosphodiesterase/3'5'-cyclic nucleotide phosphodiesterase [Babesia duncani]|uniref:Bifunctional HD-PDEase domain/3'5'-cyclic nucleotide phosphodiesterase/3'5'-cyclic nucleotide phosphodiesterase n=1 Tax=Babesia duncani TaxID=323732 RepID=A0AAD9PJ85_9APIC|nr:bifunctional HD-PDEase domain/3'5'-cyclic nucleotide phosphodiesterase/3'5'-cyclic nucleotide phosphodiesterase [Babesia duncani]